MIQRYFDFLKELATTNPLVKEFRLIREFSNGRKIVTVVPLHDEVKPGTLLGILELAEVSREVHREFEVILNLSFKKEIKTEEKISALRSCCRGRSSSLFS